MLFIFFNGGGLSSDQWFKHPYIDQKTDLIDRIKKIGKIYLYNPIFYPDKDDIQEFKLEDLDLINHCDELYNHVKEIDDEYFLISHSRGHMIANIFISRYPESISGFINMDGGLPEYRYVEKLAAENPLYDSITDDDLKQIFNDVKQDINRKENLKKISDIVTYMMYRQYKLTIVDYNFPVRILNNIYHNDEINLNMDDYVKTTLINKINYNEQFKDNKNVKSIYYVNKTHFLYFGMEDDITVMIRLMLGYDIYRDIVGGAYYLKYQKYKNKYLQHIK